MPRCPASRLITAHQYVVLDYNLNVFGLVDSIRVYNPWGIDGGTVRRQRPERRDRDY